MSRTSTRRRLGGLVAAAAVLTSGGVANASPPADSGIVTRSPLGDTAWYPDVDEGLVLLYGPPLDEGGCVDENFPITTLSTIEKPNGSTKMHAVFHDGPIQVYRSDDPFNFLAEQCGRYFDDDPKTVVDQPEASGTGTLVMHWWIHPDGTVDFSNRVVGRIERPDGTTTPVRARATYSVSPAGELDIKVLDVTY